MSERHQLPDPATDDRKSNLIITELDQVMLTPSEAQVEGVINAA